MIPDLPREQQKPSGPFQNPWSKHDELARPFGDGAALRCVRDTQNWGMYNQRSIASSVCQTLLWPARSAGVFASAVRHSAACEDTSLHSAGVAARTPQRPLCQLSLEQASLGVRVGNKGMSRTWLGGLAQEVREHQQARVRVRARVTELVEPVLVL